MTTADRLIDLLRDAGATVATAESLTGGLVCATLVDVPGASDVVRGGVAAYSADLKIALLGVPAELIGRSGTVDPEVAAAMASGARTRCSATYAVSTTGVAGPGPNEGHPAGTVFVAVAGPSGVTTRGLHLSGDRADVRRGTVAEALSDLVARLEEDSARGLR